MEISCPQLVDSPSANEVLCRKLELGICGTDREILHSANPWTPPGSPFLVLGHECVARVEAVGDAVSDWQVGDMVVPAVRRSLPGESRRLDYLPLGKFTERGIWSEHGFSKPLWLDKPEHLFRVPHEIAEIAVFTEPLAVGTTNAEQEETEYSNFQMPPSFLSRFAPFAPVSYLGCGQRPRRGLLAAV